MLLRIHGTRRGGESPEWGRIFEGLVPLRQTINAITDGPDVVNNDQSSSFGRLGTTSGCSLTGSSPGTRSCRFR